MINNIKILWLHCAIVQCAQWIEILSARVSIYEKIILKYCQIVVDHLEKSMGNKNMNTLVDMTLLYFTLMWCICIIFLVFQQRLRETALLQESALVTLSISRQKLVIKQHQYAFGI